MADDNVFEVDDVGVNRYDILKNDKRFSYTLIFLETGKKKDASFDRVIGVLDDFYGYGKGLDIMLKLQKRASREGLARASTLYHVVRVNKR